MRRFPGKWESMNEQPAISPMPRFAPPPQLYFVASAIFHYLGPAFAVLQVSALAVGLLALVLLVLLRTDRIASWRAATPPDAPNRFVINLQPEQGAAFRQHLAQAGIRD